MITTQREKNWKQTLSVIKAGVTKVETEEDSSPIPPREKTYTHPQDAWTIAENNRKLAKADKDSREKFYNSVVEKMKDKLPHMRDYELKDDYSRDFNSTVAPYVTEKKYQAWKT